MSVLFHNRCSEFWSVSDRFNPIGQYADGGCSCLDVLQSFEK